MLKGLKISSRDNLTSRVYDQLRIGLMSGSFWPGQRLRVREVAMAMGVSDTPVREAMMQLVREGGLEMRSGQTINVVKLSRARYLELREIRFQLEGMATEKAAPLATPEMIAELELRHAELIEAEQTGDYEAATLTNYQFHFLVYRTSGIQDLVSILESIWLRHGPMLRLLYPHAPPTYPARHQHLNVMDALRSKDPSLARHAIVADIIEGGKAMIDLLEQIEDGRAAIVEDEHGVVQLQFGAELRKTSAA
ncbi:MAG: GntR family transcriptional regulator [Bradyrhizobium sp.]|uniref:GntR family transcriptional regulator n=1 Tax=Bradyrhizobium sp. TaxID=376 RepID=UPI001DE8C835|nr:GntR family transcriptional regulator [Bradyrhizobium sp.]MBV9560391.1 GntR family transcriptional regulator [Bradyrhizobium sp.]